MTITELIKSCYEQAKKSGWHDSDLHRTDGDFIALCHSELSEAMEELRKGHAPTYTYLGSGGKPEGVPIELADVCIRIFDYCGLKNIDLEKAIKDKMAYNTVRPFRHGGKKL